MAPLNHLFAQALRLGGKSFHCPTAWRLMLSFLARAASPPAFLIAARKSLERPLNLNGLGMNLSLDNNLTTFRVGFANSQGENSCRKKS